MARERELEGAVAPWRSWELQSNPQPPSWPCPAYRCSKALRKRRHYVILFLPKARKTSPTHPDLSLRGQPPAAGAVSHQSPVAARPELHPKMVGVLTRWRLMTSA